MSTQGQAATVEIAGSDILVDAALLGELLGIAPSDIPALMRSSAITSLCERGADVHEGELRLTFFYGKRRARLSVDSAGRVLRSSVVDFDKRPVRRTLASPGNRPSD
jgi:hypothetical protein